MSFTINTDKYTFAEKPRPEKVSRDYAAEYVKKITDNLSNQKADKATTLAGYGITNAYTKTEVNNLSNKKVDKVSGFGLATITGNNEVKVSGIGSIKIPHKGTSTSDYEGYTSYGEFSDSLTNTNRSIIDANDEITRLKLDKADKEEINGILETKRNKPVEITASDSKLHPSGQEGLYTTTLSKTFQELHSFYRSGAEMYILLDDLFTSEIDNVRLKFRAVDRNGILHFSEWFGSELIKAEVFPDICFISSNSYYSASQIDDKFADVVDSTYEFSGKSNTINRYPAPAMTALTFTFGDGEYDENYASELSFNSGDTPPEISYTDSGTLNWLGTDCSLVDGLSIFAPTANKHYDIVFYFNGTCFVGLVNGFEMATMSNSGE